MQAPHPPLKAYYQKEAERRGWVNGIFDRTAPDYERVERIMALGSGSRYRRKALLRAGLGSGMQVVDVGTGTGLTARQAVAVVGPDGHVLGVDPSPGMIGQARATRTLELKLGSADAIPERDAVADFLCMGYALRHIADLSGAFREFMRVLKPGGRLCLLEITRPAGKISQTLLRAYMRGVVPMISRCVARQHETPLLMRYYWDTIEACAAPDAIVATLRDAGFVDVTHHVELTIFSEYRAARPA